MSVTSYAEEEAAIFDRLRDFWTAATPIAWPNGKFKPTDGQAYLEPRINRQDAFNADLSPSPTKRVRHPGLLTVDIRVPIGEGEAQAFELADNVCAIYRNVTFDRIHFRAPTVRPRGRETTARVGGIEAATSPWFLVQVDCPFYRDSFH